MTNVSNVRKSHGNWWAFLLMGILLIVFSILLIVFPIASFSAFAMLFAIGFFISGVFEIIFSLNNKNTIDSWGWYLVGGIIDLVLGIILLSSPLALSAEVLVLFVGLWLLFRGINSIGIALETKNYSSDWGFLLFFGILEVIISFIIVIFPPLGIGTIIIWASIVALFLGVMNIYIGLRVKKFFKELDE